MIKKLLSLFACCMILAANAQAQKGIYINNGNKVLVK